MPRSAPLANILGDNPIPRNPFTNKKWHAISATPAANNSATIDTTCTHINSTGGADNSPSSAGCEPATAVEVAVAVVTVFAPVAGAAAVAGAVAGIVAAGPSSPSACLENNFTC